MLYEAITGQVPECRAFMLRNYESMINNVGGQSGVYDDHSQQWKYILPAEYPLQLEKLESHRSFSCFVWKS